MSSPFWTKKEAASYARCSERTIDRAARRGELQPYKIGAEILFKKDALMAWVETKALYVPASGGRKRRSVVVNMPAAAQP